jgi:dephospho-CoA kinase
VPARLRERFGPAVLLPDGSVDRAALAAVVFADESARLELQALIHPLVGEAFGAWVRASAPATMLVHEVPLLFEGGLEDRYDRTLVVTADPELRRQRIGAGRIGFDLEAREATQLPAEEKARRADDVIVNDGSREELRAAVAAYATSVRAAAG